MFGDGRQTRSFCDVDDLIRAFLLMMASPAGVVGPINVGNPVEFTMLELADKVLTKVGGRSKIVFKPLPGDDPRQRQPDIATAHAALGWKPTVGLDDGLEPTIDYFRRVLQ
jgi:UDP-glucuronate decarboxylase